MDILNRLFGYFASPTFPWKDLIIGLSVGKFMFESFITLRQCRVLCRPSPPAVLKKEISQETFVKAQRYGLAKAKFSLGSDIWHLAVKYLSLKYDILPKFWQWSGALLVRYAPASLAGGVTQSILFVAMYMSANMVESGIPEMYYDFVLEESFGFNKQSLATFLVDKAKTFFITNAFLAPSVAGFHYIISNAGDRFALYVSGGALAVRFIIMAVYPNFILPLYFKMSPIEDKELKDSITALTNKLSFPLTNMYLTDGSSKSTHSNAFFAGFPWQKSIFVFDTLVETMSASEVTAVVAHELGHWNGGHTARLFVLAQVDLLYSFGLFSQVYTNPHFYSALGFHGQQPAIAGFLLFCQLLPPFSSAQHLLLNIFTRKYEYEADAFAKQLGIKEDLSSALVKLNVDNLSTVDADPLYSTYHHSHPLLSERLRELK